MRIVIFIDIMHLSNVFIYENVILTLNIAVFKVLKTT